MISPNLRQVEAFRAVMLTGKVTSAAELMGVTQPAVSRLISDFEHATRLTLFERRGNRITPTGEAVMLMREVDRAFVGLDRIASVAEEIGRSSAGTLRIAGMAAVASGILPRALAHFMRARANLTASIDGMPSHLVIEAVASGQADLGYADEPFDRRGFAVRDFPAAAIVAVPRHHALAEKKVIAPADLVDEPLVSADIASVFAMRLEAAFAEIPRRRNTIRTNWWQSALALVDEGAGIALVDPLSASAFTGRNIVFRPFAVFVDAGLYEIRPQHGGTKLADAFAAEVAEHFRRHFALFGQ